MIRLIRLLICFSVLMFIAPIFIGFTTPAYAAITVSGDYDPSWSFWTGGGDSATAGTVGVTGEGRLTVDNNSRLQLENGTLGREDDATGTALVTGAGSHLDLSGELDVGLNGSGSLTIRDGGVVTNKVGGVGLLSSGVGEVIVDGAGSEWVANTWLVVGYNGNASGSVLVQNGGRIQCNLGWLGSLSSDAVGEAVIRDAGSMWTANKDFAVGNLGKGTLYLLDGGVLDVGRECYIGNHLDAMGTAHVLGGVWNGGQSLNVGNSDGVGILNISQGGLVNMGWNIKVHDTGTINIMADGNNILNAGIDASVVWSKFINEGVVNLVAPGGMAAGSYSPITNASGGHSTYGTINGVGGTWDAGLNQFIVNETTTGTDGPLGGRRIGFASGALVVGFADGVGAETFTVQGIDTGPINGNTLLAAYRFDTTMSGDLTALTCFLADEYDKDDLRVWRRPDGSGTWTLFDPVLTDYTNGAFTFTVDEFSSYAVTGPPAQTVPTLSAGGQMVLCMLLSAIGVFWIRRKRTVE